ncbi:MAG TPA: M64 family metallopeptidase [Bacteroidales bacterium]|nr:M64 family metallopeptidase [Bacteroidales bacterium]
MKHFFSIGFSILFFGLFNFAIHSLSAQVNYNDYFTDNSLRLDYYHTGTDDSEQVLFKEIRKEAFWGGSKNNLIDKFGYGSYLVKVFDKTSGKLIFSYAYCSLFEEWQFTEEAKSTNKGFPESIIIPFPKNEIIIELYKRQFEDNSFSKIFDYVVHPDDVFINSEQTVKAEIKKIHYSAESDKALDLVFIGDGYTKTEINEFYSEVNATVEYLFSIQPFKDMQDKINIWAVAAISDETGTDIPQDNIWKSTALNTNFNTFGSERYLTSSDYHAIRNYAGLAPCDQICILVNTNIYGGGGIYNFWNISSSKNEYSHEVFAHELGHSLGALGDEYYDSEVSTEDIYNKNTEPYQANLTTLVDFDSKWKDMVSPDTKIPTELNSKNINIIGVYEGGGYQAKGIYRPFINCKMKALGYDFCPVCQRTLTNVIKYYSE